MNGVDVLTALLLVAEPDRTWDFARIGEALHIGAATAHRAMSRLSKSGLVDIKARRVRPVALEEFLLHGLKYVFPATPGPQALGVPTAHSAPFLADRIAASAESAVVWPSELGRVRGASIEPLHGTAAAVALERPELYELLALTDVLRLGRAREIQLARRELSARVSHAAAT